MFPDPINALSSLIAKIPTIEISTKKQDKVKSIPIVRTKLRNLRRLFFSPLISIGKIPGGFCLYQQRETTSFRLQGHNHRIYWNCNLPGNSLLYHLYIETESKRARLHRIETHPFTSIYLRIPSLY